MKMNRSFSPAKKSRASSQHERVAELVDSSQGNSGLAWRNWRARLLFAVHDGRGRAGSWQAVSLTRDNLVGLVMKLTRLLTTEEEGIALSSVIHGATWPMRNQIAEQENEIHRLRWRIHCLEADAAARVPAYNPSTALVLVKGGAS
jgi:hypothetical protein